MADQEPADVLRHVEIGSADLTAAGRFYGDVLGLPETDPPPGESRTTRWFSAGPVRLALIEVGGPGSLHGWVNEDLQEGVRHLGFKVADVDAGIARLAAAGATVLSPPADVLGDVRIAFFLDPDGTRLEFVQGHLAYQQVESPELAAAEARRAAALTPDDAPVFDHVAITVPQLPAALGHYGRREWPVIGSIRHHDDPRGFLMTYLQSGPAVLEVFSFDVPTDPNPWRPEPDLLGVRAVAVGPDTGPGAGAGGTALDPAGLPVTGVRA